MRDERNLEDLKHPSKKIENVQKRKSHPKILYVFNNLQMFVLGALLYALFGDYIKEHIPLNQYFWFHTLLCFAIGGLVVSLFNGHKKFYNCY